MNELDLQRRMLADPGRLPAEAFEALARSPRLAAQHEGLLRADEEMHHWLTQAVVPDGLADRIILRARYGTRSRWR